MNRSLKTFFSGLFLGLLLGFAVKILLPGVYFYFLLLLEKKTQVQTSAVGSYSLAILLNNLLASFLCAYGGYFMTKAFLLIDSRSSTLVARLGFLDKRIARLSRERLKYYLSLHALPAFVLFFNGLVLGFLFVLYYDRPSDYFKGLMPHGFFEIPAILLAGSIGYRIADAVFSESEDFKEELEKRGKREITRFLLVIALLIFAAFLEA